MTRTRTRRIWIRIGVAATAIFLGRLGAATLATAQNTDHSPSPATVPLRTEIGGTVAWTMIPDFGLLASLPLDGRFALEVGVARMPPFLEEAPGHLLAQAQVRMPFRTRLASRKSVLAGVTSISRFHGDNDFLGSHGAFVRPHAGLSFERPVASTDVDFRFDVQGIFTFDKKLQVLPRLMAAWVWHRRARR